MLAVDTNLLFYASNPDAPQHLSAYTFLLGLGENERVVISELVLAELYRLLRNPVLNVTPLGAAAAASTIETYRNHPSWRLVGLPGQSRPLHDRLWQAAADPRFPYQRLYDARLAFSLLAQGVTEFATANVKDFQLFGFQRVWNPLE